MATPVVGLRSMHGYSVADSDGSPANCVKSLRGQFGQIYDGSSARNIQPAAFRFSDDDGVPPWRDDGGGTPTTVMSRICSQVSGVAWMERQ